MTTVHIALGSNIGDRAGHLDAALAMLRDTPGVNVVQHSPVYETEPVGPTEQGAFLNAAAELQTDLSPQALLAVLQAIEASRGRTPQSQRTRWGPRELDLDILLFGQRILAADDLVIPHPLMHERWFVLKPLADIAPGAVHPILEMTVEDLLSSLVASQNRPDQRRTG